MPFPNSYIPGQSADEFSAGQQPQRHDGSDALARIHTAQRNIAGIKYELAASYNGNDSPKAKAALDQLRAFDARPGARGEILPPTREVPAFRDATALSHDEMMSRLRRADPGSRRQQAAPDPAFVEQVVAGVLRELPGRR